MYTFEGNQRTWILKAWIVRNCALTSKQLQLYNTKLKSICAQTSWLICQHVLHLSGFYPPFFIKHCIYSLLLYLSVHLSLSLSPGWRCWYFLFQSKLICSLTHSPSTDHFHTDAVVPSSDHCCIETVLPPSDNYCIETVAPSGDRCTKKVASSSSRVTTRLPPNAGRRI